MLKRILERFCAPEAAQEPLSPNLAAAALLVEVMASDDRFDASEEQAIQQALVHSLGISENECQAMLEDAKQHQHDTNDLYTMTRAVNDHFDAEQKYGLIRDMWRVAWADGELDRYEDNTIRKVAELIYVPHEHFIRAKLETQPQ